MSLVNNIWQSVVARFRGSRPTEASAANRDPKDVVVRPRGVANTGSGAGPRDYQTPEFDLVQITNAYNTEAYVRQAVDKYIELMFKSGWDIVGSNSAAVTYVKLRLAVCAEATQTPIDQFFIGCAEDLVKYSNSVIAKARENNYAWPKGLKVQGIAGQAPVIGYFPLNVTTMSVRRDKHGAVKGWQQETPGAERPVRFKADDIVHIYYKREKGAAFGTPFLLPALDDIRALREAEEKVLRLIHRNLYPFQHHQVGNDDYPAEDHEVLSAKHAIENMEADGGLITSHRHNITTIATDKIIDAHPYLKYFEERVFTGLGVPATIMGRGSTANRSTSDNMSTEFIDRVKALQKVFSVFVDEFIIKELLIEGGFDPLLNPQDDVDFVFKEIDIDTKVKVENHAIFQYEHNAITEDEMRALLGREPITDRAQMYMNLVTIPVADAKATAGTADTDNRNSPANQHKKKQSSGYVADINQAYLGLEESVIMTLRHRFSNKIDDQAMSRQLASAMSSSLQTMMELTESHLGTELAKEQSKYITYTIRRTYDEVVESINNMSTEEALVNTINIVFDILGNRVNALAEEALESLKERRESREGNQDA